MAEQSVLQFVIFQLKAIATDFSQPYGFNRYLFFKFALHIVGH